MLRREQSNVLERPYVQYVALLAQHTVHPPSVTMDTLGGHCDGIRYVHVGRLGGHHECIDLIPRECILWRIRLMRVDMRGRKLTSLGRRLRCHTPFRTLRRVPCDGRDPSIGQRSSPLTNRMFECALSARWLNFSNTSNLCFAREISFWRHLPCD